MTRRTSCKHTGDRIVERSIGAGPAPISSFACNVCEDCGEWLSLGPSRDYEPAVLIEIEAAHIVAECIDPGTSYLIAARAPYGVFDGWAISATSAWRQPETDRGWAGWLAHVITHPGAS